MDPDTAKAFTGVGDKIDLGFTKLHEKVDDQRKDIHQLEMSVQDGQGKLTLCREQMEPRVQAIETGKRVANQRTWEVVKPVLTRAVEVAIFAIAFFVYLYMTRKGG